MSDALVDELVERSGLSPLFARSTIRRACERAGVKEGRLRREDLPAVVPEVERAVRTFLEAERAEQAVARLRALLD